MVKCKVASARFSPAIENGRAVSSNVTFEITVPYDSLVEQCMSLPPNFVGTVIDTSLKLALPKSRILLFYTDTTEDTAITIGFNRYLSIVDNCKGQMYDGKLLMTETDSLGHFAFRLLPRGHFSVSVQSAGYEIGQFKGYITGDTSLQCQYILRPSEKHSNDSSYAITVYGRSSYTEKKIIIAEEEKHTGFSPYLSNVIQAKAEIRRVPEGPSKMLVRSGCPFDNTYVIAGVPMLAPFHFGGHPFADIDGIMISALSDVNVTINDIAAKRIDASGCIVEADPGKINYDKCHTKGFYLKGDFSYTGVDLLAAYTAKENEKDFIQIGYSVSDDYFIKWKNKEHNSASKGNYGIGIPVSYGNLTLAGSKSIDNLRCSGFGWFAWDSYDINKATDTAARRVRDSMTYNGLSKKTKYPWGMGSVTFNTDSSNKSLTMGGARQFFGTGKQFISSVVSTRSFLNNGEITVDLDTIIHKPFVTKLTSRINHDEWYGYLVEQKNDSTIDTTFRTHGTETGLHLNTSLIKQIAHVTMELDLLASAIHYKGFNDVYGDAGVSMTYTGENYQAGIHFGRITSRPDIRGLPDSHFRRQLNHTYIGSIPLFFNYSIITKFGFTPYVRYSTNAPQLDPVKQVWNPNGSTPIIAYGADIDCRITPMSWAELTTALNLADTRRQSASNNSKTYEWNLPWTIRTSLHLKTKNDAFHIFIDYICSKGLPYYDIENQLYDALPVYRSLDLNLQFHARLSRQRHINLLECYGTLKNVRDLLGTSNVRDYYWNSNGDRRSFFLGNGRMDIGFRFGIRL
ncbi:MAG: carboxypeptidase regulatory-like domain-containing protein [Fibrobacter sp.]|nr:carboxypeptidase regulatory-like domain-containing protein [Fibrobacter sp.]